MKEVSRKICSMVKGVFIVSNTTGNIKGPS